MRWGLPYLFGFTVYRPEGGTDEGTACFSTVGAAAPIACAGFRWAFAAEQWLVTLAEYPSRPFVLPWSLLCVPPEEPAQPSQSLLRRRC